MLSPLQPGEIPALPLPSSLFCDQSNHRNTSALNFPTISDKTSNSERCSKRSPLASKDRKAWHVRSEKLVGLGGASPRSTAKCCLRTPSQATAMAPPRQH